MKVALKTIILSGFRSDKVPAKVSFEPDRS
jgi:hypothetical protein